MNDPTEAIRREEPLAQVNNSYQRIALISIGRKLKGIRYSILETWGGNDSRLFAFFVTERSEIRQAIEILQ